MIKVLNLYAGIGGNRRLWNNVEVTAIELHTDIAEIYATLYPNDNVIVTDAHQYLLENYNKFDFIWSSPPCFTHSKLQIPLTTKKYIDISLYQEIILLQNFYFRGKWIVENTEPYYTPLVKPTTILQRHCFWSNFAISNFTKQHTKNLIARETVADLEKFHQINLIEYNIKDKRKILRNCVDSELGLHLLQNAFPKYDFN